MDARCHVLARAELVKLAIASIAAGIALSFALDRVWLAYAPPMPLSPRPPIIEQRTERYDLVRLRFALHGREADCYLTVYHDSATWTLHC